MDSTKIVAWWGAILATIVFGWDICKHKTAGPRLRFTVHTGMQAINTLKYQGQTLILAKVTNYGERPTTITNLMYLYFEKRRFFRKKIPDQTAIVAEPNATQPLPFTLQPGAVWTGAVIQDLEIENMASNGILDFMLYHSHTSKPMRRRVVVRKKK